MTATQGEFPFRGVRALSGTQNATRLSDLLGPTLLRPEQVKGLFCKIPTRNDDAGRHGVLVPMEAYPLFPSIAGFVPGTPVNYTEPITSIWRCDQSEVKRASSYKHYHRYPERRLTGLSPVINSPEPGSILVIARRENSDREFEIHLIARSNPKWPALCSAINLEERAGAFFLDIGWQIGRDRAGIDLHGFLEKFDAVAAMGPVNTLRRGPTGVGYTFETLMGIAENNLPGPDFQGIEIKCFRRRGTGSATKKNLFLIEPIWVDGIQKGAERVKRYGYFDRKLARPALYSAVTARENSHRLKLYADRDKGELLLLWKGTQVAKWTASSLQRRLEEKLAHTVFVGAKAFGLERDERFSYQEVTYCEAPSVEALLALAESGEVVVELRMHVGSRGNVRNHGTCFRVFENRLTELYGRLQKLRE